MEGLITGPSGFPACRSPCGAFSHAPLPPRRSNPPGRWRRPAAAPSTPAQGGRFASSSGSCSMRRAEPGPWPRRFLLLLWRCYESRLCTASTQVTAERCRSMSRSCSPRMRAHTFYTHTHTREGPRLPLRVDARQDRLKAAFQGLTSSRQPVCRSPASPAPTPFWRALASRAPQKQRAPHISQ